MNDKYTIENFERWLNADKSRKRGLYLWKRVIAKVKSDSDLFNSLATGEDLGGWNLSDPKFRKQYQFEDYYQVFLEWKIEMDSVPSTESELKPSAEGLDIPQPAQKKPNEEEENKTNQDYPALSITEQEPEYRINPPLAISSIGTKNNEKNKSRMPFGSALLTDTGSVSDLKKQKINYIIHAAMMPLLKNRNNEEEFIKIATLAIQNSIILTDRQKLAKLATCFLGGNIYCPVEEVKPILAEAIIQAGLNQLKKCSHLKEVVFVDFDGDYYKNAWEKIKQEGNYSEIIEKTKVVRGDLLKKSTHKAKIIINSENAEMEWRSGISGAIEKKLGSEAEEVDQQRKKLMKEFNDLIEKEEGEGGNSLKKTKQKSKSTSKEEALEILGLMGKTKVSKKEIKKTYKKLSLQFHPDKLKQKLGREPTEQEKEQANKDFKEIDNAYKVLVEEIEREEKFQAIKKIVGKVFWGLAVVVVLWLIWRFLIKKLFRN